MSFSAGVKNEIARILGEGRCCLRAELAALLAVNSLTLREEGGTGSQGIVIATENAAIARKVFTLLRGDQAAYRGCSARVRFRGPIPTWCVCARPGGLEARCKTYPWNRPAAELLLAGHLRGAFLAGSSITNPERGYHLEIAAPNREVAAKIGAVMEGYDLVPEWCGAKGKYVIYLKEGERLVRFLSTSAPTGPIGFENIGSIRMCAITLTGCKPDAANWARR